MPSRSSTALRAAISVVLGAIAIAALFWPAFVFGFFSDDRIYITENALIQSLPFSRLLVERANDFEFLPLRDMTYWLEWRAFGKAPLPYHVSNLLWYLVVCSAVFFAARRLLELHRPERTIDAWVPLAVAAIFLAHPLHIEPVVWIAGRKDLMSCTFVLIATGLWAQGLARRQLGACWLGIAVYLMAIFSKMPAVVFPVVAALLWLGWADRKSSPRQWVVMGTLIVAGAVGAYTALAVGADTKVISPGNDSVSTIARAIVPIHALGAGIVKGIAPYNLRISYDQLLPHIVPGVTLYTVAGVALIIATVIAVVVYLRRRALWAICVVWFFVFLLPTTQVIPFHSIGPFSDRFALVPSFGAALLAGMAIQAYGSRQRTVILAVVLVVLGTLTLVRASDWRSIEDLLTKESWESLGSVGPQRLIVTELYLPQGRYDEAMKAAGRVENPVQRASLKLMIENHRLSRSGELAAWRQFIAQSVSQTPAFLSEASLNGRDLLPEESLTAAEIARAAYWLGMFDEALIIYRSIRDAPTTSARIRAEAAYNVALALQKKGQIDDALRFYYEAAQSPTQQKAARAASWNNIGALQNAIDQPGLAEEAFKNALAIDPRHEFAAMNLASIYVRTHRKAELERLLQSPAGELPRVQAVIQRP